MVKWTDDKGQQQTATFYAAEDARGIADRLNRSETYRAAATVEPTLD